MILPLEDPGFPTSKRERNLRIEKMEPFLRADLLTPRKRASNRVTVRFGAINFSVIASARYLLRLHDLPVPEQLGELGSQFP